MDRIGVDIDGVIIDILGSALDFVSKKLKREVKREEVTEYYLETLFNIPSEEMAEYFKTTRAYKFSYLWQSKETLELLKWFGYDLYAVTARPKEVHQYTLDWVKKDKLPFSDVIFANAHSKIDIVKELNLAYFIEDKLETVLSLSNVCKKVFLIDAPHNKMLDLPRNVIRAYSWETISKEMIQEYARKFNVNKKDLINV